MAGKGSQYERDVCRLLTNWWLELPKDTDSDVIFWRTSGSGARATSRASKGKSAKVHCGDICAIDPIGKPLLDLCSIEIKRGYSTVTVFDVLDKKKGAAVQQWEQWYNQVTESAKQAGTPYWLLITRRDRREAFVFMPWDLYDRLWEGERPAPFLFLHLALTKEPMTERVVGMLLECFLDGVKPLKIKELVRW